jgi:hypothetical protein
MRSQLLAKLIDLQNVSIWHVKDLNDVRVTIRCQAHEFIKRIRDAVNAIVLGTHVLVLFEALRKAEIGSARLDADALEILIRRRNVEAVGMAAMTTVKMVLD